MNLSMKFKMVSTVFTFVIALYALKTRQSHGRFLIIPFEFRFPTPGRVKQRWWNPGDKRIFTPHVFGIGWSLNMYQVLKKLGVIGRNSDED